MFAGLAFHQNLREDVLLCSSITSFKNTSTGETIAHKPRISISSNNIFIVLYSLQTYSTILANLAFTTTNCAGITINPCEYVLFCTGKQTDLCKSYLEMFLFNGIQVGRNKSYITLWESLHTIHSHELDYMIIEHNPDVCLNTYLSTTVVPRLITKMFEKRYYAKFIDTHCYFIVKVKSINLPSSYGVLAEYIANIQKSEKLQIKGSGNLIKSKHTIIDPEEMFVTDLWFNAFAVEFSATGIVELASFSMASSDSGITFFIYMKGVTTSAMMFTVGVHSVESFMKKVGPAFMRLLQLTANVSINTMALIRGIKPGKLNPLRELNSLPYGYLLKFILKDLKLSPNTLNITIFQIVVQSKFCIFKCHRTPNTGYQLEQCETLDRNDFRDTKKFQKYFI